MKSRKLLGGSLLLLSTMLVSGCNGAGGLFSKKTETFKVTWKNYDGSILEVDENIAPGTKAEFNGSDPVRQKDDEYTYTFSGWDKTPGEVTADTEYTAKYDSKKREYDITWYNWDNSILATTKVAYGVKPECPVKATRPKTLATDYVFATWYPDVKPVEGKASYKAVFTEINYSVWKINYIFNSPDPTDVVFNSKGHEAVHNNNPEQRDGGDVKLYDAVCPGYTFIGWYLDAGYTKKRTEIKNISQDMVLYGKFELGEYKIKYDLDNGSLAPGLTNPDIIHCTDPKVTLEKPSKDGYEFIDWQDADGNVYKELENVCSDLELKACYEPNEYVITLRYNDMSDVFKHIKYDEKVDLPELERDGYVFLGWYYESDPTQKFNSKKYDLLEDVVLVQKWAPASIYHIVYELGGGANPGGAPTEFSVENYLDLAKKLPEPTKKGYTFKGWKYGDTPISLLRDVFEYNDIYQDVLDKKEDLVLTAVWEAKEVEIKLNFNGGTLQRTVEYYDGSQLYKEVPISTFEYAEFINLDDKTDAQFNGWLDEDGKHMFAANKTVDKDLKLKAAWEEIGANVEGKKVGEEITFNVDGDNSKVYQYTPLVDCDVNFASEGTFDVKAELITKKDGKVVISHDDISSTDVNFDFDYSLKANETYLLRVTSQTEKVTGEVKINVTTTAVSEVPTGRIDAELYNPASVKQKFDSKFEFPYTPVRDGHEFDCWVIEGTDTEYHSGHIINEDENEIKLEARWL